MAARVSDLEGLPYWPRMLSRDQAASYVGVSPGQFAKEVEEGRWPAPERRGTGRRTARLLWDRLLLDRRQDERSGLVQLSPAAGTAAGGDEWAGWS